jgi:hypothetical protein
MRLGSLQRFGYGKVSYIQDLPHPERGTLSWFGYHLSVLPQP